MTSKGRHTAYLHIAYRGELRHVDTLQLRVGYNLMGHGFLEEGKGALRGGGA
jgi:hypothetical protein